MLNHFHYNMEIRLNTNEFDTKLSIKKQFFVFILSQPFEVFLKRVFNFHSTNGKTLNKEDCMTVLDIIHGRLIREGFG